MCSSDLFLGYARISLGTDEENARLMDAVKEAWPHDQGQTRRAEVG